MQVQQGRRLAFNFAVRGARVKLVGGDSGRYERETLAQEVLLALGIAAMFVVIAGFFAVLVTGKYPEGARDFLVGVYRYNLRVQAYIGLLTDQYPPFALSAGS
jgi:hypothetical protein